MPDPEKPAQLKEWFDEARHRAIARDLGSVAPRFDRKRFLTLVLDGLEDRSLMQRLHQCAVAVDAALPGDFRSKVAHLHTFAPSLDHEFVAIFLSDFVATFGQQDFDFSLEALRRFTVFGSAEFAVRPFLVADQDRALAAMSRWTSDPDDRVRRLASEGSRPRLPWGMRLAALIRNPDPTGPILEALKLDPSLFVRRSVANHLNDITKDHPDRVLGRLESWDLARPDLQWIARHACRTLVKRGHPRALGLFGFGRRAKVDATVSLAPRKLSLGDRLTLTARLTSTTRQPQPLVVDYVVHYVKANGTTSEKVFKWTEVEIGPRATVSLAKSQVIRDFTTRRHYPGRHQVELQINGVRVAAAAFELR